jgi:bifunctional aspartokinase / homoserine dehydrogenase 1
MTTPSKDRPSATGLRSRVRVARSKNSRVAEMTSTHAFLPHLVASHEPAKLPLRVMKFGGTSVGSASSIARVVEIVLAASRESNIVVVTSAMSGVTNKLAVAIQCADNGDASGVAAAFEELRVKHETAANALIQPKAKRNQLSRNVKELLRQGAKLCARGIKAGKLSNPDRDFVLGLGERLSTPLVAATLASRGVACKAMEATELIVTDSNFGAAEPMMNLTRQRCTELTEMLHRNIIPVVTGFIGATVDGAPTTLGRNSSDYSATILGAALDADEVTIWTDVDGVLTADPHLVPRACAIPEISYHEASQLACFGAKVLHPKTLVPVMQSGIPISIRNTFAPDRGGSRITPTGPPSGSGTKALAAISDSSLISVDGSKMPGVSDVLARALKAAAPHSDVLLICHSTSAAGVSFVVPSGSSKAAFDALQQEFAQEILRGEEGGVAIESDVSIITIAGENLRSSSGAIGHAMAALNREKVRVIAITQSSSASNVSFVVPRKSMQAAMVIVHRELDLDAADPVANQAAGS